MEKPGPNLADITKGARQRGQTAMEAEMRGGSSPTSTGTDDEAAAGPAKSPNFLEKVRSASRFVLEPYIYTASKVKDSAVFLKDTLITREDIQANLLTGTGIALIRAGINWGTGGTGLAVSAAVGAGLGGVRGGLGEVYKQYESQKTEVKKRLEDATTNGTTPDTADLKKNYEADQTKLLDVWKRYQALEDKGAVNRAALRGAAYGALGAAIGVELKEYGVADFVKGKLEEHVEKIGVVKSLAVGLGGSALGASLGFFERYFRGKKGELASRRTAVQMVVGGLLGAGAAEYIFSMAGSENVDSMFTGSSAPTAEVTPTAAVTPGRMMTPDANGIMHMQPIGGSPSPSPDAPRVFGSPSPDGSPVVVGSPVKTEVTVTPSTTSTETPLPTNTPTAVLTATSTETAVPSTPTSTAEPLTPTPTSTEVPVTLTPTQTAVPLTSTPTNTPFVPTNTPTPEVPTAVPSSTEVPATPVPKPPTSTVVPATPTPDIAPSVTPEPVPTRHPILMVPEDSGSVVADSGSSTEPLAKIELGRSDEIVNAVTKPAYIGVYPSEVRDEYVNWYDNKLSSAGKAEFDNLLDTSKNPVSTQAFTRTEPLFTDAGPHPDFAPLGSDMLSLKGQLQGLYIENILGKVVGAGNDTEGLLEKYGFDPNDAKVQQMISDLRTKGFDPFNADHLKLRDLAMQDQGIDKESFEDRVNALYGYVKRNTPTDNFDKVNSDYWDRKKGIFLPQDLGGWFDKLGKIK